MKPRVIGVDLDGTLSPGSSWTPGECLLAVPNERLIEKIRELYKTDFIVIHTARRHDLYEPTIQWLNKHNIPFHAVRFEKMPCDVLIDFDAVTSVEEL